jgi:hypothetical protein
MFSWRTNADKLKFDFGLKQSTHFVLSSMKTSLHHDKKLAALIRIADWAKNIGGEPECFYTAWWNKDGSVFLWPATGEKYAIIRREMVRFLSEKMLKYFGV